MSPTAFAAPNKDSSASERAVPVVPEHSGHRVIYPHLRSGHLSYKVTANISFDFVLERGDGYWTVSDAETGIYGDADDVLGALEDFYRAAAQHLDVLERQDSLSPDLSRQLDYLRARVRR